MPKRMTLRELMTALQDQTDSDAEVVATMVHLVNSGAVVLGGKLRGAHFAVDADRTLIDKVA